MQSAPIGVFDSGVGGLSVLRALCAELPAESFVYFADSGHAPYGERGEAHSLQRASSITQMLKADWGIKALVVACNTATAAAVGTLRQQHPLLPIVGVEPALRPAVTQSRTRRVGVISTRVTLGSQRFVQLRDKVLAEAALSGSPCDIVCAPCDGLALAIEQSDAAAVDRLCTSCLGELGAFGDQPGDIDVLVLGCTHYPFANAAIGRICGPSVALIDTALPVARQTRRVLASAGLLAAESADLPGTEAGHRELSSRVQLLSSGGLCDLQDAAKRWLGLDSLPQAAATSGAA